MNKILSSTLCFGLLTLSSVLIFLQSVHGRPYFTQGNEILPDKNDPNREELLLALLNKNFDFQRPFNTDLALPNKLEELNQFYQLEKLKEQLVEKDSDMSYAIDGLFSSHPSKRGPGISSYFGTLRREKFTQFIQVCTSTNKSLIWLTSRSF
ncbi:urotensin-2B isoform X3 [Papio anubis]|uniref:urotensin-2B isoform X3 n=1 Tax=Papio anubis TaxID=9555 RepID=UPI0012AD32F0|nr:urotensin-2B isoform X3 [Papio anubis]